MAPANNRTTLNERFDALFNPEAAPPLPAAGTGESVPVAAAPAAAAAAAAAPAAIRPPAGSSLETHMQALNVLRNTRGKDPDKSYVREWKLFRQWVDLHRESLDDRVTTGSRYLTRENVDAYFILVVPHITTKNNESVKRIVPALNYYAMWDENESGYNFEVKQSDNCLVARGIAMHKILREQEEDPDPGMSQNALPNLYDHLSTNVVTGADTIKAMTYVLKFRTDWASVCPVWNNSFVTYIRNMSARGLFLSDLYLDMAHGPEPLGPLARSMNNVLRKGIRHKDRFIHDKVVGSWRHKNYLQCCTGMTAASITWRLHNEYGSKLHFLRPTARTGETHEWFWRHRFVHEELAKEYADSYRAFKDIFSRCDISSAKLTHLRKSGIDYAGCAGLSNEVVSSMSKHITAKFQKSYQAELREDVQRVMAGFAKNETWYVPRATLGLPMPIEELVLILFPHIQRYRHEVASRQGDKQGMNFVHELLPFFAEVVVQDGIYWVKDFPTHPVSIMLTDNIPHYLLWAEARRAEVLTMTSTFDDQQIMRLNMAAQAALKSVLAEIKASKKELATTIEHLSTAMRNLSLGVAEINQRLVSAPPNTPNNALCARCSRSVNTAAHRSGTTATGRNSNNIVVENNNLAITAPPPPPPRRPNQVDVGGTHLTNPVDRLRSEPAIPAFGESGNSIPSTFVSILYEYIRHRHDNFERQDVVKKHWGHKLNQAFGRRQKCMAIIRARAGGNTRNRDQASSVRLSAAAKVLDSERKSANQSMSQYMDWHLRQQIATGIVKGRAKRMQRAEEDDGETMLRPRARR
jgi:hypothetical protein